MMAFKTFFSFQMLRKISLVSCWNCSMHLNISIAGEMSYDKHYWWELGMIWTWEAEFCLWDKFSNFSTTLSAKKFDASWNDNNLWIRSKGDMWRLLCDPVNIILLPNLIGSSGMWEGVVFFLPFAIWMRLLRPGRIEVKGWVKIYGRRGEGHMKTSPFTSDYFL